MSRPISHLSNLFTRNLKAKPPKRPHLIERLERREVMANDVLGDFNQDGYSDLAQGDPEWNNGSGRVSVMLGTAMGFSAASRQDWFQGKTDSQGRFVKGENETGDLYGADLAVGDFNGDGVDDLAIGASGEDRVAVDEGAVNIIFGRRGQGLVVEGNQWFQAPLGDPRRMDYLGANLAAGDFNCDGVDDLAMGLALKDLPALVPNSMGTLTYTILEDAGAVDFLFGRHGMGLTLEGATRLNEPRYPGDSQAASTLSASVTYAGRQNFFGSELRVGDFNDDGWDDLAISTPNDRGQNFTSDRLGSVFVRYGGVGRTIQNARFQAWTPTALGANTSKFGDEIQVGDFNGDGVDDLAIVARTEVVRGMVDSDNNMKFLRYPVPAVHVLYSRPASFLNYGGLTAVGAQYFTEDALGGEAITQFGTLGVGDFNGDGADDLAFGVGAKSALKDDGTIVEGVGAVYVVHGVRNQGLNLQSIQILHQDLPGVAGERDNRDGFGGLLLVFDLNRDGRDDLAVGVRDEGSTILEFGGNDGYTYSLFWGTNIGLSPYMPIYYYSIYADLSFAPTGTTVKRIYY